MVYKRRVPILILNGLALFLVIINLSCTSSSDAAEQLRSIHKQADPYEFNYIEWELQTLIDTVNPTIIKKNQQNRSDRLSRQIAAVLEDYNIQPIPVPSVRLETPPNLLIISKRDKIVYYDRMLLKTDISSEEIDNLERDIDKLGVVSLIEGLGGFGGTFPSIVDDKGSLSFIVNATVEEWAHQYLALRPLGFLYLLDSIGLRQNSDVIIMNETLAQMISEEIGEEVIRRFYTVSTTTTLPVIAVAEGGDKFDFNIEMRETRKNVDIYLDKGNINEAEQYMEERRLLFIANGYKIRKLNQAYFAFHGIYGHDPASVRPVYQDLKKLRKQIVSLKEFLDKTAAMTSYNDLTNALKN